MLILHNAKLYHAQPYMVEITTPGGMVLRQPKGHVIEHVAARKRRQLVVVGDACSCRRKACPHKAALRFGEVVFQF